MTRSGTELGAGVGPIVWERYGAADRENSLSLKIAEAKGLNGQESGADPRGSRQDGRPGRRDGPPPGETAPAWKVLVALLSLALSLVLWLEGLVASLERPSVVDALSLRQLELAVVAESRLPPTFRPLLVGEDPAGELIEELDRQQKSSEVPPAAIRRLERILLEGRSKPDEATEAQIRELVTMVDVPRRALLESLLVGRPLPVDQLATRLEPWNAPVLVEQLSCERLSVSPRTCPAAIPTRLLIPRLLTLSVLPALLLLLGIVMLLRQAWKWRRGTLPPAPPLVGPPLGVVDVVLLIAGAFVILGEVLVPVVLQPSLTLLMERLEVPASLGQALQVVLLYLGLMIAPLGLLKVMLPERESMPGSGWLQWHPRPVGANLGWALSTVLVVLPFVGLAGWLIEQVWDNPGGSNPLLDLVLTSSDPWALLCFAFTAIVLAPIFEETLFRGVLLPVVGERLAPPRAVLISAVIFAVAHLSLTELVPLLLLGIGLGWVRWRSGSLTASVWMHALWNGFTFVNLLVLAD